MKTAKNFSGYITGLVVVLVVVVVSILWTIPELQRYLAINRSIEQEEQRIADTLVPKRDVLLGTSGAEIDMLVDDLRTAVPESSQPVYLLAFLEELGSMSGVEVIDPVYVFGDVDDTGVVVLSASIVGGYAETVGFFDNLSNAAPVFRILQFSFYREFDDEGGPANTSQIIVSSPFKPLPGSLGSIHTPVAQLDAMERQRAQEIAQRIRPGDSTTLLPDD